MFWWTHPETARFKGNVLKVVVRLCTMSAKVEVRQGRVRAAIEITIDEPGKNEQGWKDGKNQLVEAPILPSHSNVLGYLEEHHCKARCEGWWKGKSGCLPRKFKPGSFFFFLRRHKQLNMSEQCVVLSNMERRALHLLSFSAVILCVLAILSRHARTGGWRRKHRLVSF